MALSASSRRNDYTGNGDTVEFDYTFKILDESELDVFLVEISSGDVTPLELGTDYSVDGVGASGGGKVTLNSAPASTHQVSIIDNVTIDQEESFRTSNEYRPVVHENAFDAVVRRIQVAFERFSRSIRISKGQKVSGFSPEIQGKPSPGFLLAVDEGGTGIAWKNPDTIESAPASNSVTNAMLVNMAENTIKGRVSSGSGEPEDLTPAQVTALLNTFTDALKGLVPASGGGTDNFLRADGQWAAPPGGGGVSDWGDIGGNLSDQTDLQEALNAKADLDSPALTGTPTAPTQSPGDDSTAIATTEYVDAAVAAGGGGGSADAVTFDNAASGLSAENVQDAIDEVVDEFDDAIALLATIDSPEFTGNPTAPTPTAGDDDTSIATTEFVNDAIAEKRRSDTFTGTSITPTARAMDETWTYTGESAQNFMTTGFGSLATLPNGYRATILGTSNTNTLTIAESDITDGRIMNGDIVLGRGKYITFEYNSTLGRMVEIGRSQDA